MFIKLFGKPIDYRDVKTSFCFLDETGLLNSPRDKYFAIGIVKCGNPENLYNRIRRIRSKYNYNEELKWARLDRRIRLQMAREFFKIFMSEDCEFNSIILDKDELDFEKYYDNNMYKVYRNFTVTLLKLIIGKNPEEVIVILADDYFAPEGTDLEDTIKKFTNSHYKRFVIAGVCQIDSKSNDVLQMADLILGAIAYDLKKHNGLIQSSRRSRFKRQFLNFVYQKLSVDESFFKNGRNFIYDGRKIRASIYDPKRSTTQKFINNCPK